MCSLRDAATELAELGVEIYGVSLDDVSDLSAFALDQELEFPLLSDPDGGVAAKYGVLPKDGRFAQRVTFVIDPEGVLRHVDAEVQVRSHGADLVELVRRLQG